ncbi:MAG: hypothetical protein ACRC3B_19780 [Bacteroidia bacterium]
MLVAALLLSVAVFSQSSDFPLLYSHGKLPYSFTSSPEQRANDQIQKLRIEGVSLNQGYINYIYSTEYAFTNFIYSGHVTTGDSVSKFAQEIADNLLDAAPEMKLKVRIYLLRSTEARIYNFGNGNMLLSTGLVAKMETEAQLSFMIAREIIHLNEKHYMTEFRSQTLLNKEYASSVTSLFTCSIEQEKEADNGAYTLLRNTGYATSECSAALHNLDYDKAVFGNIPFNISFFEHGDYIFPDSYKLPENTALFPDSVKDPIHKLSRERAELLKSRINNDAENTAKVKSNKRVFERVQLLTREEVIHIYIEERKYAQAIYGAYVLLTLDSNNVHAIKAAASALNALSMYRANEPIGENPKIVMIASQLEYGYSDNDGPKKFKLEPYSEIDGQAKQVSYLLHQFDGFETAALALQWCWKTGQAAPEEMNSVHNKSYMLMRLIKGQFHYPVTLFATQPYQVLSYDSLAADSSANSASGQTKSALESVPDINILGKFPQIGLEKMPLDKKNFDLRPAKKTSMDFTPKPSLTTTSDIYTIKKSAYVTYKDSAGNPVPGNFYNYYEYAFVDCFKDSVFASFFAMAPPNTPTENLNWSTINAIRQKNPNNKYGLSASSVVIHNIGATWQNEIGRKEIYRDDSLKSASQSKLQYDFLKRYYSYSTAKIVWPFPEKLTENDAEKFSVWCMYASFISEFNLHLSSGQSLVPQAYSGLSDTLTKKFGTPYLMSSFAMTRHMKRVRQPDFYVLSILFPLTTIPAIIYGVVPRNKCKLVTLVYNMQTGYLELYYDQEQRKAVNTMAMNLHYTDVLTMVKRPAKNKLN